MDINRRHLIGASAASAAGALAMSPDGARAAPLTSALGRDATQYGVRPGSPDDQTRALQRAIEAVSADNDLRVAAFVHVPLIARGAMAARKGSPQRITLEGLVDAGEAMLLEMVKLARQRVARGLVND